MREAREGDRYLLCSDGLSDPVSHETILEALQITDVAESADRLIELALRGGGPTTSPWSSPMSSTTTTAARRNPSWPAPSPATTRMWRRQHRGRRASAINLRRTIAKRVVAEPEPPPKPRSRRRVIIAATLVLLLLVAGLVVGNQIIQSNYYVTAFNGTVTIMRASRARSWATDCRSRTCGAASTTATSCPRSATAKRGNRLAAN